MTTTLGAKFEAEDEVEVEVETTSVAEDAAARGGERKIRRRGGRGEGAQERGEREKWAIIVTC